MPMTVLGIGSAVAGGLGSIFGGSAQAQAQAAQARMQNLQAQKNWIQNNTQTTINNSRQQFQAAYQYEQQLKRNSAIAKAAYAYQSDAKDALRNQSTFQQAELSKQISSQKASLLNSMTSKGISARSGMYGALATMQAIDSLKNAVQLEKNRLLQAKNIDTQTNNMLSQQSANIFMPNIQLYGGAPTWADPNAGRGLATAGLISGIAQLGGAALGAMSAFGGSPPSSNGSSPSIGYSDGMGGASADVGGFSNTPQAPGFTSGNMGFA